MAEKRTIELEVKESGFKSLKAQIKEANIELIKAQETFGDYSDEALKAARSVAGLKDKIAEAGETAALFDPGAKFQVATGAITAAAGAVSAYQGAMGLLGVESEAVEEAMMRVQSAMALSQGLSAIADSRKDFERLAAILGLTRKAKIADAAATATQATVTTATTAATGKMTIAQKALNLVMKANPIFLIIGAIGALVAAYALFSNSAESAAESNEKLNTRLERQLQLTSELATESKRRNDKELELMQAEGASEEELHRQKLFNMAIEKLDRDVSINDQLQGIREKTEIYKKALEDEDYELAKSTREEIDAYRAKYKELIAANKSYYVDVKIEKANFTEDEINEQNRIAEEAQRKADAAADKRKAEIKAELEEINKFTNDATKANLDAVKTDQQLELDTINDKFNSQLSLAKKYGKDTTQLIEAQKNEQNLVNTKYAQIEIDIEQAKQDKLDEISETANQDRIKLEDAQFELERSLTESALEKELMDLAIAYDAKYLIAAENAELIKLLDEKYAKDKEVINKTAADAEIALSKLTTAQKIEAVEAVAATFNQLANLLGEQTTAGKAAAIAAATIETFLSAQKAYSATVGIPIVGPVLAPINAGIAIAAGIKNIKAIASVKTPGGGGGSGNVPSAPSGAGGVSAPNFNIVGNSGINQLAELGGQPIQAYVVSGEVTSAQSLDRNRVQNATF